MKLFLFPKRIELVRQIAESHAEDGDDDVGDGRPDVQHLDEELQAKIVDEDVDNRHEEIPDNLRPALQCGARETDVARHPETRQESDGELEHEGRDMGREGQDSDMSLEEDIAKIEDLTFEDEMIENIVQHPFQNEVQATASRIAEQLKAHHLAEWRIEEVNDFGQSAFDPGFYVFQG